MCRRSVSGTPMSPCAPPLVKVVPDYWGFKPNSLAVGMRLPMLLEGAANQVLQFCAVRCASQLDSAHYEYCGSNSKEGSVKILNSLCRHCEVI